MRRGDACKRAWRKSSAGFSRVAFGCGHKTQCPEFILAHVQFRQLGLARLNGSPPLKIGGWAFFFLAAILAGAAVHAASAFDTHDGAGCGGCGTSVCSLPPVGGASCDSRLKRTVCISCGCLQTSKLPSVRRDVCETPSLAAGGVLGGVVCHWRCCIAVPGRVLVCAVCRQFCGVAASGALASEGAKKKALTLANQGFHLVPER